MAEDHHTATVERPASALVGRWFHSFHGDRNTIEWQGQIVEAVSAEVFLVQLYEWFSGGPSKALLVPLSHMAGWAFYPSHADMNDAYEDRFRGAGTGWNRFAKKER